jgi:hypothetical protein
VFDFSVMVHKNTVYTQLQPAFERKLLLNIAPFLLNKLKTFTK